MFHVNINASYMFLTLFCSQQCCETLAASRHADEDASIIRGSALEQQEQKQEIYWRMGVGHGSAIPPSPPEKGLKGLSHEIEFKNFDQNLKNLA